MVLPEIKKARCSPLRWTFVLLAGPLTITPLGIWAPFLRLLYDHSEEWKNSSSRSPWATVAKLWISNHGPLMLTNYAALFCLTVLVVSSLRRLQPAFDLDAGYVLLGLAVVVFTAFQLPRLRPPSIHVVARNETMFGSEFREDVALGLSGEQYVLFRVTNVSNNVYSNCSAFFSLPKGIELYGHESIDQSRDFWKKYHVQRRNNAVAFYPNENYQSVAPFNQIYFLLKLEMAGELGKPNDTSPIEVRFSSESVWGTAMMTMPIAFPISSVHEKT